MARDPILTRRLLLVPRALQARRRQAQLLPREEEEPGTPGALSPRATMFLPLATTPFCPPGGKAEGLSYIRSLSQEDLAFLLELTGFYSRYYTR